MNRLNNGFNLLNPNMAVLCFQYCDLPEFVKFFASSHHFYNIAKTQPLAWKYLTFNIELLQVFDNYCKKQQIDNNNNNDNKNNTNNEEQNDYTTHNITKFLLANPVFKNI